MVNNILKISFFTNFFLAIFKIMFGIIGKSNALISDGIHSFSDLVTDIVALFGNGMSLKPPDYKHPYGHGKSEYITSFTIGIVILFIGFTLIHSMSSQKIVIPSLIVVIVTSFAIIIKYLLSNYLLVKGEKLQNAVLISSGKESRTDVISSLVVLLSSICMYFSDLFSFFKYSDKIAAIIVGILIIRTGFEIIKESISMILGEIEENEEITNEIKKTISNFTEVESIDELILIKYGPYYTINAEISMDGNLSLLHSHTIIHEIEKEIKDKVNKAEYIMIHVNPCEKDR